MIKTNGQKRGNGALLFMLALRLIFNMRQLLCDTKNKETEGSAHCLAARCMCVPLLRLFEMCCAYCTCENHGQGHPYYLALTFL